MSERALRVAVVGCGNISGSYGETMGAYPTVRIAGATDVDPSLSAAFVDLYAKDAAEVGRWGGCEQRFDRAVCT